MSENLTEDLKTSGAYVRWQGKTAKWVGRRIGRCAMKRMLSALTCAMAVCIALVPASRADDSLIAAMELEIRIQDLSEDVYKKASNQAWEAAKKTTLGRKWLEAAEKSRQANEASLALLQQKMRVSKERREYERAFQMNWYKERRSGWWLMAIDEDARAQELEKQEEALWERYLGASEKSRTSGADALFDKLHELAKKFTQKLYFQEMEKRLIELQIEITKDVLKKIEKSYRLHTAFRVEGVSGIESG